MGSVSREDMEKSTSKPISAHSLFLNGYPLAGSYRFGQLQPHFVQEIVPDDDIELSTSFKLDTYTLSQPLMQDMFISHGYYFVPYPCLLPRNFEKFYTNPVLGDDIDAEEVGLSWDLSRFRTHFTNLINYAEYYVDSDRGDDPDKALAYVIRFLLQFDMIFGLGGLSSTLGYKFIDKNYQVDFENLLTDINSTLFGTEGKRSIQLQDLSLNNPSFNSLHPLFELLRDDFDFSLHYSATDLDADEISDLIDSITVLVSDFFYESHAIPQPARLINVGRILSYQVVSYHFFSNDKIDYIYTAELYRQNVNSARQKGTYFLDLGDPNPQFVYNGEYFLYDVFSASNFNFVGFDYTDDDQYSYYEDAVVADCQWLRLIFGFNNSLRHVDYFTGARSQPLAVGDVGVKVNSGYVDVVDNIQTTWFAKFLNQVNRTGRRLSNYVKGLFPNAALSQDWHEPLWLGDTTDRIGASETENTGDKQFDKDYKNSITSTLSSNASKYGFRYQNTQYPGWIIGLTYFDLERFYAEVTERPNFHVDRFDMFNPFLQFNGDQEVYGAEIQVADHLLPDNVFGYQSRYLEYKQRVPQCFGAFEVDPVLSKSIFIADTEKNDVIGYMNQHISPSYIRSHPLEFDKFYLSLTGLSLAFYYHFQIIHWNRVKSVRPMVKNPQLG